MKKEEIDFVRDSINLLRSGEFRLLYKECPKSYGLLCSRDDHESISSALEQLRSHHPDVFFWDESAQDYFCFMMSNRFGLYVLKKCYDYIPQQVGSGQIRACRISKSVTIHHVSSKLCYD